MEKIEKKHQNFIKSVNNLEKSLDEFFSDKVQLNEYHKEIFVIAIIKLFEISYESCWKFLKLYLEREFSLILKGSKDVFRQFNELKILDEKTVEELLTMVDIRNSTSHSYYEMNKAQNLVNGMSQCLRTFKKIKELKL